MRRCWLHLLAVSAVLTTFVAQARSQSNLGFDYLVLSSNLFTIHGLWPNNDNGNHPAFCDDSDRFSRDLLTNQQLSQMSCEWRSFKGSNNGFWSYEWSKHGTCALALFPDESAYFGAGLALNQQYSINEALAKNGVNPLTATGVSLQTQLLPILEKEWGVTPQVTCYSGNVFEVRLCVSPDLQAIDCPSSGGSCSSRNELGLPSGGPTPPSCATYFADVGAAAASTNTNTPLPGGRARPPPPPPPGSAAHTPTAVQRSAAVALLLGAAVMAMLL
ncbi:Ribonuclease Phyb [Chlorella vulgaris]